MDLKFQNIDEGSSSKRSFWTRSLVVSDLSSKTKGSWFESCC